MTVIVTIVLVTIKPVTTIIAVITITLMFIMSESY